MKRFETDVFVMDVYEDTFLLFTVKKDANLEPKDLWESRKLSLDYLPGKKFYVLMQSQDFFSLGPETRRVAASKEYSDGLNAVALCSPNLTLKILGSLYMKINKPHVITRFFDDATKAEEWLRSVMKLNEK